MFTTVYKTYPFLGCHLRFSLYCHASCNLDQVSIITYNVLGWEWKEEGLRVKFLWWTVLIFPSWSLCYPLYHPLHDTTGLWIVKQPANTGYAGIGERLNVFFFFNLAQNDDTIGGVKTHSTIWVETVYVICRMENEDNQSESNYIDVGGEIWQRREEAREKEQCRDGVTRRNRLQQRKPKGRIAGGRTRIKDNERRRQEFFFFYQKKKKQNLFVSWINLAVRCLNAY